MILDKEPERYNASLERMLRENIREEQTTTKAASTTTFNFDACEYGYNDGSCSHLRWLPYLRCLAALHSRLSRL